jgi:hypothetical protein
MSDRYMRDTVELDYEIESNIDEWRELFNSKVTAAAISTKSTDDDHDCSRLTFIDNDEAHEPDAFDIVDEYNDKLRISIYDRDIPTSLNGYSPSMLHGAEVVLTYDDETKTGFVTGTDRQYNKSLFTVALD